MNRRETAEIMDIMQLNYPDSFKDMSENAMIARINLWAQVFADDPAPAVNAAVMAHISSDTGRFMPPAGVIKTMLVKLSSPEEMTEAEAWAHVAKAIRRSAYHAQEEFEKLPPICKLLVGSPAQLREWAVCERPETMSVAQSNFMRSYRARVQHEKEFAAFPQAVKAFALEAKKQFLLEERKV